MDQSGLPAPEFCRIVECDGLGPAPARHDIEADAGEREALARRFGLERLDGLAAKVSLKRNGDRRIAVDGSFLADLAQTCIVSLEPVPEHIEESFSLVYASEEGTGAEDLAFTLDDNDWPEPLLDGKIDIGEAVAQQLALALEPYPRALGATHENQDFEGPAGESAASPFAALAGLKKGP